VKSRDSVETPARSVRRGQQPGSTVIKCGLRSQAAGVKSRPSGDIEVIITKRSMASQYESPGRDKLEDRKRCQSGLKILVQHQYPGRTSGPIAKGRSRCSGCVRGLVRFSKGPTGDGTERKRSHTSSQRQIDTEGRDRRRQPAAHSAESPRWVKRGRSWQMVGQEIFILFYYLHRNRLEGSGQVSG
jgi:hypothetical protein